MATTTTGYRTGSDFHQYRSDPGAPSNSSSLTPEGMEIAAVAWAFNTAAIAADYTGTDADCVLPFDCTAAGRTFTLPTAVGSIGRRYLVYKTDAGVNTITINTTSSQTVSGAASGAKTIGTQYAAVLFISNGANWIAWTLASI